MFEWTANEQEEFNLRRKNATTLELDLMVYDSENIDDILSELVGSTNATASVLAVNGPGGGVPLVKITGDEAALKTVWERYQGGVV